MNDEHTVQIELEKVKVWNFNFEDQFRPSASAKDFHFLDASLFKRPVSFKMASYWGKASYTTPDKSPNF